MPNKRSRSSAAAATSKLRVLAFALHTFNQGQAGADWGDDIYTVPAVGGTLDFWISADTEVDWDFVVVEAHEVGLRPQHMRRAAAGEPSDVVGEHALLGAADQAVIDHSICMLQQV